MLPAAVRAKADRARELQIQSAAARGAPASPAPITTPTPAVVPAAADVAALQKQLADTEAKLEKATRDFAALQRKLDVEGPRSAADLRAAKEELKKAQDKVTELDAQLKKKLETLEVTSLSDEERGLAGADLVKVTAKVAREVAEGVVREALKPYAQRVDLLEQMGEETFNLIVSDIPNFSQQNDDPGFIAWLNQTDPKTGRLRLDRVRRAESFRQGNLVAEIFAAYREKREIGAPKAAEPPPAPPLEKFVDPGAGGGGTPPDYAQDDQGRRIWRRVDISQFYDEKRRGVWRGKEAEARTLEQDISAAYTEGRIRG